MDKTSQKLFEELSGIGSRPPPAPATPAAKAQETAPELEDGKHDRWRMLLVELAYLINASFRDVHYWEGVKAEKDTFRQLSRILDELDQMPVHDGWVRITHRGVRSPKISEQADYLIQFGDSTVDVPAVVAMINRMGIRLKHLEGRLIKSFETFADQGFCTLLVKLPGESPEALEALKVSLRVISCFKQAVEKNTEITLTRTASPYTLFPIRNAHDQPDPNLTMLAAVNNLNQTAMTKLVEQVSARTGPAAPQFTIFETIFKIKSLQQRLTRPPLEVNIDADAGRQPDPNGSGGVSGGRAHLQADPSALKAGVARFVKGTFGQSPQTASRIMKSIYGKDYRKINSNGLGQRLRMITDLFNRMQKSPPGQNVAAEVLRRIQSRLDQVPDEILDDFIVRDEEIKFWSEGAEATVGKVDKDLLKIIDDTKSRSEARKQRKIRLNPEQNYTIQDFEAIAADFGITARDAAEIIGLFKDCFDNQGIFLRMAFEKNVPGFAAHEKKVFEILWDFLKETPRRDNRLPLLNSLQLLVRETKKPIQAIKALLAYFLQNSDRVTYADRNAIMLVNQFLRSYNKEINMDIEMTPEEVLHVEEGLDLNVVNYVAWKVDAQQKLFLEKMVAIRKRLVEAINADPSVERLWPIRFLLALEREVHIFLALVGGKTAFEVMRSALNVYGNPASQIYRLQESPNHLETLLLHLSAIIRGYVRQAGLSDFSLLAEVRPREDKFRALHEDLRYHAMVRRVMELIDAAEASIH